MEIKVEVKLIGLEPLVDAIKELAIAHSSSALQAGEAINKASRSTKKTAAAPAAAPAEDTKSPEPGSAETQSAGSEKTAENTQSTSPSQDTSAPAASAAPLEEKADPKPEEKSTTSDTPTSGQASSPATGSDTSPAAAAGTAYSNEKLRELAGEAAKRDRPKVQALVTKYAPTVSQIPDDQRAAFVAELAGV